MEAAKSLLHDTKEAFDGVWEVLFTKKAEYKSFLEKYVKIKTNNQVIGIINKLPDFIKRHTYDPDMPGAVRRAWYQSIDTIWPDIQIELIWESQVFLDSDEQQYQQELEVGSKPDCIRAFLRYHLFPYDKGIWACIRDPLFVVVNILAIIPYMGIYAWMYVFIWLIIDKTDEYQLVYFILSFKGAQFFSWGILKGFIGNVMYFLCTTYPPIDEVVIQLAASPTALTNVTLANRMHSSCETRGPGMSETYWVTIASWLLPLGLVWLSLFLLPCSKEKGRSRLRTFSERGELEEREAGFKKTQGGYLRKMLIFDFIIFIICVGLMFLIIYLQPDTDGVSKWRAVYNATEKHWQVKQTLFFCQFIYGVFSIVFVPFVIPFLQAILTHSPPTGYNSLGQCCKFRGPDRKKEDKDKDKDKAPTAEQRNSLLTEEETDGILANMQRIAKGKPTDLNLVRRTGPRPSSPSTPAGASASEST